MLQVKAVLRHLGCNPQGLWSLRGPTAPKVWPGTLKVRLPPPCPCIRTLSCSMAVLRAHKPLPVKSAPWLAFIALDCQAVILAVDLTSCAHMQGAFQKPSKSVLTSEHTLRDSGMHSCCHQATGLLTLQAWAAVGVMNSRASSKARGRSVSRCSRHLDTHLPTPSNRPAPVRGLRRQHLAYSTPPQPWRVVTSAAKKVELVAAQG